MAVAKEREVFTQEVSAVTTSIVIFLEDYFLNLNPHQNGPSDPMQNGSQIIPWPQTVTCVPMPGGQNPKSSPQALCDPGSA